MRRAVMAILLVAVVVLGSAATGAVWLPRTLLARADRQPQVLIQQKDGNLALVGVATSRQLTADANGGKHSYSHPTPAPDGRSVVYVETVDNSTSVSSALVVHPLNGERRTVFSSDESRPFYINWSPDGRHIAFLTGETNGSMTLRDVAADGATDAVAVIPGQPSYFAWTPDSQRMLLHTNGSSPREVLSLWKVGDAKPRPLQLDPAYFRAPAWLPDGRSALATIEDGQGVALARLGEDGSVQQRLARTGAGIVFVPAPNGQQVAYIDMTVGANSYLHLVGVDGNNDHAISKEDAVTFLWSPDSRRVAYMTVVTDDNQAIAYRQMNGLRVRWNVHDLVADTTQSFPAFTPSEAFFNLLPYFDQYAQSLRLWDRAGQHLLYADDQGVWSIDVTTGSQRKLGDGVLGLWLD